MAKSKRGIGDLALMFGALEGRVSKCYTIPAGMSITRRGKRISKVCFPKTSVSSKHIVKVGKRTSINVAHLQRLGVGKGNPGAIAKYKLPKSDARQAYLAAPKDVAIMPSRMVTPEMQAKSAKYVPKKRRAKKG